ncbi:MAG: GGDEF domain-containing protein [Campylobacterota bacterium]|nr:GGDEF domain-containing protein [Campylobacterota bacterium]
MKKDWSSFQISFLLYLLIVVFPVNLYFANALIEDTQSDTATINEMALVSGTVKELSIYAPHKVDAKKIAEIDTLLRKIKNEFMVLDSNQFSVGFANPQNEFAMLQNCWQKFKVDVKTLKSNQEVITRAQKCWKTADKVTKVIVKMADMKRERALNALYLSLVFTMILMVAIIYFVRTYMKLQLDKHTIYDLATKLFNRDYFLAELPKVCSLSSRNDHKLSLILIAIDGYEDLVVEVGAKNMDRIFEIFGGLLVTLTRGSDVACRYSEEQFAIITPETSVQHAMVVAERIHTKVIANDFGLNHPVTVSISVAKYFPQEDVDSLLQRSSATLKEAKKLGNNILMTDVKAKR